MSEKAEEEKKVEEEEEEEAEEETTTTKEPELPPEVDAFFKGKNKYKHPYGAWKPVVKAEPLKRLVLVYVLFLCIDVCFSVKHLVISLIYQQIIGIYLKINQHRLYKK
jgi:hypothetical protein